MSMIFHSSPQLTPALTVDSPRSPPREISGDGARADDARRVRSPPNTSRESDLHHSSGQPPSSRPTTPSNATPATTERQSGPSPELNPSTGANGGSPTLSAPNRSSKPKIPAKPASLAYHDGAAALSPQAPAPAQEHVSPFSTPPSSPEKSSPSRPTVSKHAHPARPRSRQSPHISAVDLPMRRSMDRSPAPPSAPMREPRSSSTSRRSPPPEPPRQSKPLSVQIPPGAPGQPSSLPSAFPTKLLEKSDSPHDRPGLPPRQPPPTRSGGRSPTRQTPTAESPTISRTTQKTDSIQTPKIQRQPSASRENRLVPPPPAARPPQSDEEPVTDGEPTRIDYPDASSANRRPPILKSGPSEITTRYDTRLMDVCGKHVCTTGYITRVWDLTTGEQIMSLSHGETVKSLSLSFKPGSGLEDEGQRVWIGTNSGELHEIDVFTGSVVASRAYPSRREVIRILRHKKEMWTLDDEGRLLVWPPDETGVPSLQYSYHSPQDRVARGHTFSMVVGDRLWLAAGKEVHVYRPDAHDGVSFRVLKKPLGSHHSGEVTSGAYTSRGGGLVYLGHADGKVTVYSAGNYACLNVVSVSLYKLNCLGIVGDHLWAAYKTGMIYVYDTNTSPWTVLKDWRAHSSPVCGFLLDTSSVWTLNRLQVTSLGTDNCIRSWDGMLEDDWLGKIGCQDHYSRLTIV